ncbi:MAG: glutathione S-transferase N-terminal domain-containing protein [Sedimenticola sp.]
MIKILTTLLRRVVGGGSSLTHTGPPDGKQPVVLQKGELELYCFRSCPYCYRVQRVIKQLGLDIEMHNPNLSRAHARALLEGGGKNQVPCLLIRDEKGTEQWLYESTDINNYLQKRFGAGR